MIRERERKIEIDSQKRPNFGLCASTRTKKGAQLLTIYRKIGSQCCSVDFQPLAENRSKKENLVKNEVSFATRWRSSKDPLNFLVLQPRKAFFRSRISEDIFSWPILPKKKDGKMAIFGPKPWHVFDLVKRSFFWCIQGCILSKTLAHCFSFSFEQK